MDWQTRLTAMLRVRLFTIGDTDTTVGSALAVVAILVVTYLVARSVRRLVGYRFSRHKIDDDLALQTTATVMIQTATFQQCLKEATVQVSV